MCPLRVILILLSAVLAGFFLLWNHLHNDDDPIPNDDDHPKATATRSAKVRSAICSGFWTCVDMASGRYLWRNLTCSSNSFPPPTSVAKELADQAHGNENA